MWAWASAVPRCMPCPCRCGPGALSFGDWFPPRPMTDRRCTRLSILSVGRRFPLSPPQLHGLAPAATCAVPVHAAPPHKSVIYTPSNVASKCLFVGGRLAQTRACEAGQWLSGVGSPRPIGHRVSCGLGAPLPACLKAAHDVSSRQQGPAALPRAVLALQLTVNGKPPLLIVRGTARHATAWHGTARHGTAART